MNKQYNQVKEFHTACGIEMPSKPTMLDNGGHGYTTEAYAIELDALVRRMKFASENGFGDEVLKRSGYIGEELAEFLTANTIEDQVDALTDLLYFVLGTFTLMGIQPEQMFNIVAQANLGKVQNGTVLRDEQGKIMKPPGWHEKFAPEALIRAEIERQAESAVCEVCNGESKPIYGLECPVCEVAR